MNLLTELLDTTRVGLSVALPLFLIGVLSPGPATLAIMSLSARQGRRDGLLFAFGVSTGSLFWGTCAAIGLGGVLAVYASVATVLKIAGGIYLLWLSFKSLRTSWKGAAQLPAATVDSRRPMHLFVSGLMLHLLNPKAIFVWLAVISIAMASVGETDSRVALLMVIVCWMFSLMAFTGYALLFSSHAVVSIYRQCARFVDGLCGALFMMAGLKLLSGR